MGEQLEKWCRWYNSYTAHRGFNDKCEIILSKISYNGTLVNCETQLFFNKKRIITDSFVCNPGALLNANFDIAKYLKDESAERILRKIFLVGIQALSK